jgi:NAD(P)-dependent dehydrogenase (short-subunit alcohol dehydrogenase family)
MPVAIDLSDKVVLITGSSRGIGRECALFMARAGARIAVNHRDSADQAAEVASKIGARQSMVIQADIADHAQAAILVAKVVDHFGRLDILVNNAATFAPNPFDGPDYHQWQEGWRRTLQTNIEAPANLVFLALPQMRRQGGGKVINISSRAAWRGETEFPDYGASKAALVNLTRSIARACAKYNITSTCVAPGFIDTEMAAAELARRHDEIVAQVPLGRVGSVEDVAGVVLFLASPMADYLNGATVDVNGGSWFH